MVLTLVLERNYAQKYYRKQAFQCNKDKQAPASETCSCGVRSELKTLG